MRPGTSSPWTVERVVAVFTVRFAVSLEEVLSAELLVALVAGEALRVPGLAESRHTFVQDRFLTSRTSQLKDKTPSSSW